ncbi:MAG TPA: hypothetical protein DCP61_01315 [Treponema sp.]|nr:hypothetical protein [Treponema sp.]
MQFYRLKHKVSTANMEVSFGLFSYAKQSGISFERNGKKNMDENPFARSDRRERKSYYRARGCCKQPTGFFSQIFLVVELKTDSRGQ